MATKRVSPTAQLLRNSRLMSIPVPLASTGISARRTASPTHQAIYSPASSHDRGDWGLKRNLPLRTKNTYIRYSNLDTLEHRTTFESSHDKVLTLKKWQEMDIPLLRQEISPIQVSRQSAFHVDADHTFGQSDGNIWGFRGPYLPSLLPGQLKTYINSVVKPQRDAFLAFVIQQEGKSQRSRRSNNDESDQQTRRVPTELNIVALRKDPVILEKLVKAYFKYPLSKPPFVTHPSAGLHYTRNNAIMDNSPRIGPQENKMYIGRAAVRTAPNVTKAFLGGIVAKQHIDHMRTVTASLGNTRKTGLETSFWQVIHAEIDERGEIRMSVAAVLPSLEMAANAQLRRDYNSKSNGKHETAQEFSKDSRPSSDWSKFYKPYSEVMENQRLNEGHTEIGTMYKSLLETFPITPSEKRK